MANNNNPYDSYLFGILEGKKKKAEADAAAQAAEEERKTMQLEADLALEKQKAGLLDDNQLAALNTGANTKTYIILGVVLVLVVGIAVYFKFRRK